MSVTPVILPKLGLTMDTGRLVAWLKREGDHIEAGEILFEVETDKSTMEVESPVSGYLRALLAAEGDEVPVAQVIALLTTTADEPFAVPTVAAAPEAATAAQATSAPATAAPAARAAPAAPAAGAGERIVASPAARKRADELGVDLATLRASKGARISVEDVEAAQPGSAAGTATRGARVPLTRMRRSIAERMTQAFRDVPQFSVSRDVDMSEVQARKASAGVSYADVLISVTARTLRDHPRLTMRYDPDGLLPSEGIHLGIAVGLTDGLVVPVLRDADTKDLATIARDRAALQDGARAGKLPADSLTGAVFSISNLGQQGVDRFTAIVNPPEAAILAVGRVREQVVAKDGAAVIRPVVTLTLSVDHRVVDGAPAAEFLADLATRLESLTG